MLNSNFPFLDLDEIQQDISRLKTLSTCLEMACTTSFIKDESELKGLVLDIAHFQNLQSEVIQTKLDKCFPAHESTEGEK